MEPVLSLVENNGLRAIDNLGGLFLAPHRRQAIHELGGRRSPGHEASCHLKRHQGVEAGLALTANDAVAHPRVSVYEICPSYRLGSRGDYGCKTSPRNLYGCCRE